MELIFAYIKKMGDFIYDQSISLSNNFDVRLENKILTVHEKKNHLENFYGAGIKNISVFVGKNGSGKTTILDIFGMKRGDRLKEYGKGKEADDEYFLLYYIEKDNLGQKLFGIEVLGSNVFYNMFENFDRQDDDDRYDKAKVSIGLVFKYENEQFVSTGKHFFNRINEIKLSDMIRYAYINESYRYSSRNNEIYNQRGEYDYIPERRMYHQSNVYMKYLSLRQCIDNEIEGFEFNKAEVKLCDEIDYKYRELYNDNSKSEYKELVREIEKLLSCEEEFSIFHNKNKKENKTEEKSRKEKYILNLYRRYIMDMLVNGFYSLWNDTERYGNDDTESINIIQNIEFIMNLKPNESSYDKLGVPTDYEKELSQVKTFILWLKEKFGEVNILCLKAVARYVGSRIHGEERNTDFGYVDIFEKMIEEMLNIPEEYFQKSGMEFLVTEKHNQYLETFLEKYSQWEQKRENWNSDIDIKFKIHFELLSEGEDRFIDTIAKIKESIINNKDEKLLILIMDEPDQALHPEWARRFIDIIVRVMEDLDFTCDIQLILSTHSPYLLTDILPANVFLLERPGYERRLNVCRMDMDAGQSCLGANIYDLMKNQFFMENTVGEFITRKLKECIRKIDTLDVANEKDVEEIEYFVDQIGENVIRRMLKKKLEDKKEKIKLLNNKNSILELITNQDDKQKVKEFFEELKRD